jgi:hypothetical protein
MIFDIRAFVLECLHLYALLMCVYIYTHVFENIHGVVNSAFCMYMIDRIPFLGSTSLCVHVHIICRQISVFFFYIFLYSLAHAHTLKL